VARGRPDLPPGCVGIVVDAKDEDAERFYTKYDFVTVTVSGSQGLRRGSISERPNGSESGRRQQIIQAP
jgi:hypothetical protein